MLFFASSPSIHPCSHRFIYSCSLSMPAFLTFAGTTSSTPLLALSHFLLHFSSRVFFDSQTPSDYSHIPALPILALPVPALLRSLFLLSPNVFSDLSMLHEILASQPLPGEGPSQAGGGPPYFRCPVVTSRLKCCFKIACWLLHWGSSIPVACSVENSSNLFLVRALKHS